MKPVLLFSGQGRQQMRSELLCSDFYLETSADALFYDLWKYDMKAVDFSSPSCKKLIKDMFISFPKYVEIEKVIPEHHVSSVLVRLDFLLSSF